MNTVWSFDLGKASIGEAVRNVANNSFPHKASLLIPAEFAGTKTAATRRRMWRTRQAHRAREKWLDEVMEKVGIEPLVGRRATRNSNGNWQISAGDQRLEREFPPSGDSTCYTSCLLRIKLLRGEKLEPWQIYKAMHSAIQHRGYDPDIPWKARESRLRRRNGEDEEEKGTRERMEQFVQAVDQMSPGKPEFHFPCYFDAWKMGLWNPADPEKLGERIDCTAGTTRDQIVPRSLVENEIRALVDAAARQIPALTGKADILLFGPSRKAYASYYSSLRKQYKLREGGANDWQGVLGQKLPRFDNRIIAKCVLIPRMNVCKIKSDEKGGALPESRLAVEVTFLMKLKNMRVQRNAPAGPSLSAKEISAIFTDPKFERFKVTEAQWRKVCEKLGVLPVLGHEEVAAPRISGRSRFCRPALDILKRLILSGVTPLEFHKKEIERLGGNTDPRRGLVPDDLKFLTHMGATWEGIYIPNQKLDALVRNATDRDAAIRDLIGGQNDPIVRHRLGIFSERLKKLQLGCAEEEIPAFGVPEEIVLEFVREDFMGKKARLEYRKFVKERAAQRERARQEAAEAGAHERASGLKMELLRAQAGECLYTGEKLIPENLDQYEIDHIVPRSKGGPDAAFNYALTTRHTNHDLKGEQTPFEWLGSTNRWDAFVNRVRLLGTILRNKKVKLLTSPDAVGLADKYTALAETAWVAKLSQAIIALHFGWRGGIDDLQRRKITVVSGGLTARIRRKYRLNGLLHPNARTEEEAEKKNRDDDRHHALDAMVINFIPSWIRDATKEHFFRFPAEVHRNAREFFGREIAQVVPENICFEKPRLEETIYGIDRSQNVMVQRVELQKLAYRPINPSKSTYELKYAAKQIRCIRDEHIKKLLLDFLDQDPSEAMWNQFCDSFRLMRKDGSPGSRVKHLRMEAGEPDEFRDLSKDGTGAYRKGDKHQGFILYQTDAGGKAEPVYAFESKHQKMRAMRDSTGPETIIAFVESGCVVKIEKAISAATPVMPIGQ